MAERGSYGLGPRLDLQQLQLEAQNRWLRPAEICEILCNYRMFHITSEPPNRPPSGSLFLFDRKVLRYFRKDGHNWRKKKDGKTVKEAHEKLKVGSVDVLHCYYAHGEENENFQRRSYWMLEQDMMHIVFVHYLDVKVNKTNVGGKTYSGEATSDSQKGSSLSSGFPRNYGSVPSGSTDSMSPTSTLTSLCEDADSEDIHQASSGSQSYHEAKCLGNDCPIDKIDARSNSSYLMHPSSGDHGQFPVPGSEYIPLIQGHRAHDIASWDNAMEQSSGKDTAPSLVSSTSIPPSTSGNILEENNAVPGNLLGRKNVLIEEERVSQALHSNWQIPFGDDTGELPKWSLTQSLGLEFGSDYGTSLLGDVTDNAGSEILAEMFTFNGELKEKSVHQNISKQYTNTPSQPATKSNSDYEVAGEASINYTLTMKRGLLDGEESLKKVDSFSRWITKEFAGVDDLHTQSSPGISWNTDDCGDVIDDTSLNLSLSQDQLFSINDFSPKWAYAESEIEVLIVGTFLKSQPMVTACNWSCMFGEVEVPAEVLANGILCCQAPPHKIGRVPFYVTCSNRFACSEVREFEYREGFDRNIDFTEFFTSSTEMVLHLRLVGLLSLSSVHTSNQVLEDDMEKRNLIFKLISLKEEEEYSSREETTVEMDATKHKLKEHMFHKQVKEMLYSWLLHKVTETGKGPLVLSEEGQGVLHLVAALGYDWAIKPIITAGVNINFRDVSGWTALHWAAYCGRERTVAVLVSMGAATAAVTDPCPEFPEGRTASDLASSNGHKGISGFLAESLLTSHLELLTMEESKDGRKEISGMKAVQTVSERTATPVLYGDIPDVICLKDSLNAVRNATQAADRIHQVYRMQSFQRKQLAKHDHDDEFGLSDQQALSLLASRMSKSGQGEGLASAAAIQIQKKFRGWKKRKEFLIIRQRIVKIQAHVRGHQVRKQYRTIIWSVGILEKVILRWRRKGSGLRGFRSDTVNKVIPEQPIESPKEDDYDFLKEGRKQSEARFQKALSRVKSMVQYPEARAQYRRVLNVVEDFRQTKGDNLNSMNSEEAVDGVEDLIDIDMLLDDENFLPIAFD
ncbi:calmodulin-binding transcription activator 2 [Vigna radiata var. radiata]|uniref:Calmodulin-binding transcription activator 2 n=1 Tax=Vigna radiata var. radiata TaxID=3916 RepID=A0A1S3VDD9_VIGRR|nr:calmodulin-binding transcription activator 2 [Vigna radiata var. radiata]